MKITKKLLRFATLITFAFSLYFLTGCQRTAGTVAVPSPEGQAERLNPLISAHELMEMIDLRDPNLVIIGVIDPVAEAVPQSLSSRPIHGSFLVWRPDYSASGSVEAIAREISGIRRPRGDMELLLSRAGVTPNSRIVVYAAEGMQDAARFFWQLRILGLENVSFLDGGLEAWNANGFPTGIGVRLAQQLPTTRFNAPNYAPADFNVSMGAVIEALENPDQWVVIDTRSPIEFGGGVTPGSAGSFGAGRIRGAVNVNWVANFDSGTQLIRAREELEAIYSYIIRGRNVIVHCVGGIRSAHTWFVLSEVLGLPNIQIYNGGWVEWSFAASEASGDRWPEILTLTEEWTDNRMPL